MTRHETTILANKLLREHCLTQAGWRFEFNNSKRSAGLCNYSKKTIFLSSFLFPYMKDKSVLDTILHEIAHALVGPSHGHDRVWRKKAIEIGCSGDRCYSEDEFTMGSIDKIATQSKYTLKCPNCGTKRPAYRRPKRRKSCGECSQVFDPRFEFKVIQNY